MFVVVVVSFYVLFLLGQRIVPATMYPLPDNQATSTEKLATTTSSLPVSESEIVIEAPSGAIRAIVARTDTDRGLGLSGRDSLAADEGMLFIFPIDGPYGFWMKDMKFPIDIVWIDHGHIVKGVSQKVSPETYPNLFFPPAPIRYVLELNSGSAERFGIASGTKLVF